MRFRKNSDPEAYRVLSWDVPTIGVLGAPPRPTNSGVTEGLVPVALHKNE